MGTYSTEKSKIVTALSYLTMKACGGPWGTIPHILNMDNNVEEWSASWSSRFIAKQSPFHSLNMGWLGPRLSGRGGKEKNSFYAGNWNPVVQFVGSRFND